MTCFVFFCKNPKEFVPVFNCCVKVAQDVNGCVLQNDEINLIDGVLLT